MGNGGYEGNKISFGIILRYKKSRDDVKYISGEGSSSLWDDFFDINFYA